MTNAKLQFQFMQDIAYPALRLPARWVGDDVILVGGEVVKKNRGRKSKVK